MTEEEKKIAEIYPRFLEVFGRVKKLQMFVDAGHATKADKRLLQFEINDLERYRRMYNERKKRGESYDKRRNKTSSAGI